MTLQVTFKQAMEAIPASIFFTKIAHELLKCEEVSAHKIASLSQNVAEETIRSLPNRVIL